MTAIRLKRSRTHSRFPWVGAALLLVVMLVATAPSSAGPLSGALTALVEPAAASPPTCDDNWAPESASNIEYYADSSGHPGAPQGTLYWNPSWEDTPGWHEVEFEVPVWIDLGGGWSNGVPTSSSNACIPSGSNVVIRGPGGDENNLFFDQASVLPAAGTLQIASGATLKVTADNNNNAAHLIVSGNVSNAGTIQLDSWAGTLTSSGIITNTGTITTLAGNYSTEIEGNLNNSGALAINGNVTLGQAGDQTYTNTGTITIATGQTFNITGPGDTFDFNDGTITNNGTFIQTGGAFNHSGGTATGNPLLVNAAALSVNPSTGSASFVVNHGTDTLTSNVAASDTLIVSNDNGASTGYYGTLDTSSLSNAVNAGTIRLETGGTLETNTLTNTGLLDTEDSTIDGDLTNHGTMTVNGDTQANVGAFRQSSGTITIASGKTLTVGYGATFDLNGGVLATANNGSFVQQSGGTFDLNGGALTNGGAFIQQDGFFNQNAGTSTGNPLLVSGDDLDLNPSSGSVNLEIAGGTAYLVSNVPAVDTLTVTTDGVHDGYLVADGYSNAGTVVLDHGGIDSLINTGTLDVEGEGSLGGAGDFTNQGVFILNGNAGCGNFVQTSSGSLDVAVTGGAGQFVLSTSNVVLDGALRLEPSAGYAASAAVGDNDIFIAFPNHASVTGGFANVTVNPPLAGGKTFTVVTTPSAYGVLGSVAAVVSAGSVVPPVVTTPATTTPATTTPATTTPGKPSPPSAHLVSEKVSGHGLTVKFKAGGQASSFQCALVKVPARKGAKTPAPKYASCKSPKTYKNLKSGKYVFYVRAVGPGGTSSPATYKFKIK